MSIRSTWDWVDSLRPRTPTMSVADLAARRAAGETLTVIDLRELQERIDKGAIPDSHHIPRGMLEFWADPAMSYHRDYFREDASFVVYCAGGGRSVLAALALLEMGYARVWHLDGGFGAWQEAGLPVMDAATTARWQRKR